jgi:hypothetical protein
VQVAPAGVEVTTYEVISDPPLSLGAENVTVILLPLVTATTFVGALVTPAGVTAVEEIESADSPIFVMAFTLNV